MVQNKYNHLNMIEQGYLNNKDFPEQFCQHALSYRDIFLHEYGYYLLACLKRRTAVQAGVLVAFYRVQEVWHIVLTLRSSNLAHHAGQISFAGGQFDVSDQNLIQTALRETYEEIGITPSDIDVYGTGKHIRTLTGFCVTPVLARLADDVIFHPNWEVEQVITLPITIALDKSCYHYERVYYRNLPLKTIVLPYMQYRIWGVTALLLFRLARAMTTFKPSFN